MRKFAYAALFATAISAPALAGALMDDSAVSVLGAPGGCSSSCTVGGADPDNPGQAQGGHFAVDTPFTAGSASGTLAVQDGQNTRGHINQTVPTPGTVSGNFDEIPSSKGHCTGAGSGLCS
jgi:hypothetical protein